MIHKSRDVHMGRSISTWKIHPSAFAPLAKYVRHFIKQMMGRLVYGVPTIDPSAPKRKGSFRGSRFVPRVTPISQKRSFRHHECSAESMRHCTAPQQWTLSHSLSPSIAVLSTKPKKPSEFNHSVSNVHADL